MIFGNPDDFAIEAEVEPDLVAPSAVWGHMQVWCGGHPLGAFTNSFCALYPAFCSFDGRQTQLDELWDQELSGLSDHDVWNLLDGALYGYHGDVEIDDRRSLREMQQDWRRFAKFNFLTNWGEQFDGYKSFLICPPNMPLRVLSRAFPKSVGLGVNISRAGFAAAASDFVDWFRAQSQRLGPETV